MNDYYQNRCGCGCGGHTETEGTRNCPDRCEETRGENRRCSETRGEQNTRRNCGCHHTGAGNGCGICRCFRRLFCCGRCNRGR